MSNKYRFTSSSIHSGKLDVQDPGEQSKSMCITCHEPNDAHHWSMHGFRWQNKHQTADNLEKVSAVGQQDSHGQSACKWEMGLIALLSTTWSTVSSHCTSMYISWSCFHSKNCWHRNPTLPKSKQKFVSACCTSWSTGACELDSSSLHSENLSEKLVYFLCYLHQNNAIGHKCRCSIGNLQLQFWHRYKPPEYQIWRNEPFSLWILHHRHVAQVLGHQHHPVALKMTCGYPRFESNTMTIFWWTLHN